MFCGSNCSARNKKCYQCHKIGYYGRKCRGSQKSGQNPQFHRQGFAPVPRQLSKDRHRGGNSFAEVNLVLPMQKNTSIIDINCRKTHALIDTGAEITSCSFDFYSNLALSDKLSQSDIPSIKVVSGRRFQVLGKVNLPISFKGAVFDYHLFIFKLSFSYQYVPVLNIHFI